MRFLLIIQGEGRGHLTQAISLTEILEKTGHSVTSALVGTATGHEVPTFFSNNFPNPVIPFASPYLVYSAETKALDIPKTISNALWNLPKYTRSIKKIDAVIKEQKPDIIINFYDVLGGIRQFLFRSGIPMVCIAHQYLLLHPDFVHPANHRIDRMLVNTNTRLTALGATRKLALSFTEFSNYTAQNTYIIPPLLRSELTGLPTRSDNYLLAYVTQHTLAEQLMEWHDKNPEINIHCFWDNPNHKETYLYSPNLHFHQINSQKFLAMMQYCRGLVTTAGFESVCEAMYLGKPTYMIPVPKHYEQACNALDAQRAGAGIAGTSFDLSAFISYLPGHRDVSRDFQQWHSQSESTFLQAIESLLPQKTTQLRPARRRELIPQFIKRLAPSFIATQTRN